jgi:2-dehydro-3-deoxyphosphogluconate aldolase/(4S)-4-hydroxy-2-oxoglutarate aldolase
MPAFPDPVLGKLQTSGIVAVIVLEHLQDAIPLATSLLEGGINAIELTLRTPVALEAIELISSQLPAMTVGAGTVLTPAQVESVHRAGAAFAVAPGINSRTIAAARKIGLPFAPGVCTPTDIELAVENDCHLLKFFPCQASGGLPYLRQIAAPFAHLGVRFLPLGGITPENAHSFLGDPLVHAIGGSWLAPSSLIAKQDWKGISQLAAEAAQLRKNAHA